MASYTCINHGHVSITDTCLRAMQSDVSDAVLLGVGNHHIIIIIFHLTTQPYFDMNNRLKVDSKNTSMN